MLELTSANLFSVLISHFVGDFAFQTNQMAENKSKDIRYLLLHAFAYGLPFMWAGLRFTLLMMFSHITIDGLTSGVNRRLYSKEDKHWFFVALGFDQMLHIMLIVGLMEKV